MLEVVIHSTKNEGDLMRVTQTVEGRIYANRATGEYTYHRYSNNVPVNTNHRRGEKQRKFSAAYDQPEQEQEQKEVVRPNGVALTPFQDAIRGGFQRYPNISNRQQQQQQQRTRARQVRGRGNQHQDVPSQQQHRAPTQPQQHASLRQQEQERFAYDPHW